MARPPFQQLAPERQSEILDLAGLAFAKSGFQGTSYNQLLEQLHLGKSSAYYYFDDKRDLFLTVIERCYSTYFAAISRQESPGSAAEFWPFVRLASQRGFEFMSEDPTAARLMQCMQREQVLLDELIAQELLGTMNDFYSQLVAEGQRLGAVRIDLPQALLVETVRNLSVTFDQWFIRERQSIMPPSASHAATLFIDLVRRMVERCP